MNQNAIMLCCISKCKQRDDIQHVKCNNIRVKNGIKRPADECNSIHEQRTEREKEREEKD